MDQYRPYVKAKAKVVRCELKITSYVVGKKDLINEWKKQPHQKYGISYIQPSSLNSI